MSEGKNLEKIEIDGELMAVVVKSVYSQSGYNFVSPTEFPLQLGIGVRKKGEYVEPHAHVPFKQLNNIPVQEFLYIESGEFEISLFNNKKRFRTILLGKGDMILLSCGHEIKFLKDTKLIEIKQGPYRGKDVEKEYFI